MAGIVTTIGGTAMKPFDSRRPLPSTRWRSLGESRAGRAGPFDSLRSLRASGPDPADASESQAITPQADVLELFGEYGSPVHRFCRSTLGSVSDADDIVQDTFLKLLQHLQSGGDRSNLRSWLFTVAANACRDRLRGRRRWLPWQEDLDRRTVDPREDAPDLDRARVAMRALAPRDRLLLSLRAQGLSYREIAAAAGIRESSVGRLLARAVARWKRGVAGC